MAEEAGGVVSEIGKVEEVMEGVASIALLPCGSISGHFIQLPHSICYGLHGTGSWEQDVVGLVEQKDGKKKLLVCFVCETLKAEKAAEDHIRQFMPKLAGLDAVVNIGPMSIAGLDLGAEEPEVRQDV